MYLCAPPSTPYPQVQVAVEVDAAPLGMAASRCPRQPVACAVYACMCVRGSVSVESVSCYLVVVVVVVPIASSISIHRHSPPWGLAASRIIVLWARPLWLAPVCVAQSITPLCLHLCSCVYWRCVALDSDSCFVTPAVQGSSGRAPPLTHSTLVFPLSSFFSVFFLTARAIVVVFAVRCCRSLLSFALLLLLLSLDAMENCRSVYHVTLYRMVCVSVSRDIS